MQTEMVSGTGLCGKRLPLDRTNLADLSELVEGRLPSYHLIELLKFNPPAGEHEGHASECECPAWQRLLKAQSRCAEGHSCEEEAN